jgi:glycosyltransferase involved in cell wall biosynthesis
MPPFSCIIPTLNRHKTLFALLDSFLAQSRRPDEIVIVDQSPDVSDDVVRQYGELAKSLPLRVFRPPPLGSGGARNVGILKSRFPILVFLDDDVQLLRRDFFERHVEWYRHEFVDVVDSGYVPYGNDRDVDRATVNLHVTNVMEALSSTYHNSRKPTRCNIGLCGGNYSARKDVLVQVDGYDGRCDPFEDRELGIRLWKHGAVILNDATLRVRHLRFEHGGLRHEQPRDTRFRVQPPSRFVLLMLHFTWAQVILEWVGVLMRPIKLRRPRTWLQFPIRTATMLVSLISAIGIHRRGQRVGIKGAPFSDIPEWTVTARSPEPSHHAAGCL